MIPMPTTTAAVADALTHARTELADAAKHEAAAVDWRRAERHDMAGRSKERERSATKRAEVQALIAIGDALNSIADDLGRLALNQ